MFGREKEEMQLREIRERREQAERNYRADQAEFERTGGHYHPNIGRGHSGFWSSPGWGSGGGDTW